MSTPDHIRAQELNARDRRDWIAQLRNARVVLDRDVDDHSAVLRFLTVEIDANVKALAKAEEWS